MRLSLVACIAVASCSRVAGPEGGATEQVDPTLEDIWAKVFVKRCAFSSCHSTEGHRSGLILATSRQAEANTEEFLIACTDLVNRPAENPNTDEELRVIPGNAQESFLVKVLEGRIDKVVDCSMDQDCNCPMPYNNNCSKTMPAEPILAIRMWIDGLADGACAAFGAEPAPDGSGIASDLGDGPGGDAGPADAVAGDGPVD